MNANDFLLGRPSHLLPTDVGEEVPEGLWGGFDFAIFTYDLAEDADRGGYWCKHALALAHAASQQQRKSYARICIVGTNLDRIPQNSLDLAATVEQGARCLAMQSSSLRLFPLSCKTGEGLQELASYIGWCLVLVHRITLVLTRHS